MNGPLEYRIDENKLKKILAAIEELSPKKRGEGLMRMMQAAGELVEGKVKQNIAGPILKVQTGFLRSSFGTRVVGEGEGIAAIVGSGVHTARRVVYANIHETGGTIVPKRCEYLHFPIRGATRFTKSGRAVRGDWHWVKVKRVTIPARKYMSRSLAECKGRIEAEMIKSINGLLEKAG